MARLLVARAFLWSLLGLPFAAWGWCLKPPPSTPRQIQYNNQSYRFPLGYGVWSSPQPVAEIIRTLLTEEMGLDVDFKPPYLGSAPLLKAIAGCDTNCSDAFRAEGGFRDPPDVWAAAEVWTTGLEEKRLEKFCASAGPVGYVSTPSLQTFLRVHQAAERAGELTGFWRSLYRTQAQAFFSTVGEVDAAIRRLTVPMGFAPFLGCDATTCSQPGIVRPGTENGAPPSDLAYQNSLAANGINISSDGWYYAPGCSQNTSTCIPVILGAQSWNQLEWCLVAKEQSLPLAITFLGWFGEQIAVPALFAQNLSALFYWWQPDNTFLSLAPQMSFFKEEVLQIRQFQYTRKVIWEKLDEVDEEVYGFLSRVTFTNQDLDQMMARFGSGSTADIACDWLRANNATWRTWLPDPTNCNPGFYYSAAATACQACQPGTITSLFGRRSCKVCGAGTFSISLAGVECTGCSMGKFASGAGQSLCDYCPDGSFSNITHLASCFQCPEGFTTAEIASTKYADCKCPEGTYEAADRKVCTPCLGGMYCPFGSMEANIPSGPGDEDSGTYPEVRQGYYSSYDDPLSVYQCGLQSYCPGGGPQSCVGDRYGLGCSLCPPGKNPTETGCVDCNPTTTALAVALVSLGFLAFPLGLYYAANSRVSVVTTGLSGCTVSGGIVVTSVQVLATYQRLELPWPESSGDFMKSLEFVLFELDAVGVQCVIGNKAVENYMMRVMFSWMMIALFFVIHLFFKVLHKITRVPAWDIKKTVNSIGAFLQIAFVSLVGITVMPLHCYPHPNNQKSVVIYPEILCWEGGTQTSLIFLSVFLMLSLIAPFLVANIVATIKAPAASRKWGGESRVIICFRFLLYRFRPDVWWWGNVFSARQLLIAFTPTIAANDANVQMMLVASTLIVYMILMGVFWPWKTSELNMLDLLCVMLLLMTAVAAGSFMKQTQASAAHEGLLLAFLIFVVLANCSLIVYAGYVFFAKGAKGSFGAQYPRKKDLTRFAHEWRALCSYHKGLTNEECIAWMRAMSNFDRYAINMTISIGQAYNIGGERRLVTRLTPERLVVDRSGPPEVLEHREPVVKVTNTLKSDGRLARVMV